MKMIRKKQRNQKKNPKKYVINQRGVKNQRLVPAHNVVLNLVPIVGPHIHAMKVFIRLFHLMESLVKFDLYAKSTSLLQVTFALNVIICLYASTVRTENIKIMK